MALTHFSNAYIMANQGKFPPAAIPYLQDKLRNLPDDKQGILHTIPLKDPVITLTLSLLLGGLGVDRFYLGDVFLGILKLISVFLVVGLIWVVIDIFLCYNKTKELNFQTLMLHT